MGVEPLLPKISCECLGDWSEFQGYLWVPKPSGDPKQPIGLVEVLKELRCDAHGHPVRVEVKEGKPLGIFYHPGRKKWVIYDGGEFGDRKHIVDKNKFFRLGKFRLEFEGGCEVVYVGGAAMDIAASSTIKLKKTKRKDGGEQTETVEEILPVLTVKREYLDLVDLHRLTKPVKRENGLSFKIPLLGPSGEPPISIDKTIPENGIREADLHLEVWPNVQHKNWKKFWIYMSRPPDSIIQEHSCYVFGYDGKLLGEPQKLSGKNLTILVEERPRLILFESGSCAAGFLLLEPPKEEHLREETTIAVDFGTSRTAVAIKGVGGATTTIRVSEDAVSAAARPPKLGFCHLGKVVATTAKTDRDIPFPTSGMEDCPEGPQEITCVGMLPSLLLKLDRDVAVRNNAMPFVDYTIPSRDFIPREAKDKVLSNLKWFRGETASFHRTNFLKAVLLLAVAQALRWCPSPRYVIRFSFPLAFGEDDVENLQESFEKAAEWVENCAGVQVKVAPGGVDESTCGVHACNILTRGSWVLTADLGGGTLDLALWDEEAEDRRLLACDSVRFGADTMVEIWQQLVRSAESKEQVQWDVVENTWEEEVKKMEEDETYRKAVPEAKERFRIFFQAIFVYIARFLAGTAQANGHSELPAVLTILLGSGWRGYEAIYKEIEEFKEEMKNHFLLELKKLNITPSEINLYAGVLNGKLEKAAVALGLLGLPMGKKANSIFAPNGFDELDKYGGKEKIDWWKFVGPNSKAKIRETFRPTGSPKLPEELKRFSPEISREEEVVEILGDRKKRDGYFVEPVISVLYRKLRENLVKRQS